MILTCAESVSVADLQVQLDDFCLDGFRTLDSDLTQSCINNENTMTVHHRIKEPITSLPPREQTNAIPIDLLERPLDHEETIPMVHMRQ